MRGGYFLPIINRNSVIPCSRSHQLSTISPNQAEVILEIFQGESRRVEDNVQLGELIVRGIPRGPAGQVIDVRFTYDANGVLDIETTVEKTGKKANLVITRHASNLSKRQLEQAIAAMQKLKIHPREESQNRLLLKRAERVYAELPSMLRDQLSQIMDYFESALDEQDRDAIESGRNQLEIFLAAHDPFDDSTQ